MPHRLSDSLISHVDQITLETECYLNFGIFLRCFAFHSEDQYCRCRILCSTSISRSRPSFFPLSVHFSALPKFYPSAQINLAQASADRFSLSFSSVRDLEQPVRLTRSTRLFMLSNILFFNWARNPTPSRTPVQPDPHIVTPACSTAQAVVALLFGPACHELPPEHADLGLRSLKSAHPLPSVTIHASASPLAQHRRAQPPSSAAAAAAPPGYPCPLLLCRRYPAHEAP